MRYTPLLFSKDSCIAGAGVLLIGTTAFFITRSLLIAKNRPLLCTEQVKEALETTALNCVIKGCSITCMNKVDGSKLRKKPYVSELLFLTLQPKEHSFKVVKESVCIIFYRFLKRYSHSDIPVPAIVFSAL